MSAPRIKTFPDWVEPMAATLTDERFFSREWVYERKFDGIRLLAFKRGKSVRLYSRNRILQNEAYPGIFKAVKSLGVADAVLDGEAVGGRYHVFDVIWLNGKSLTALPLDERRVILRGIEFGEPIERVSSLKGERPWDDACAQGWEGVIAKRRDAPYEQKRSRNWLKMKCELAQEFVVGGFTDPQRSRVALGALLVGYFENDDFVFAGKVGTGFDNDMLTALRARFDKIEIAHSPFTKAIGLPRVRAHWVQPEVVIEVAFMEWTKHGKLRHSRMLRVRDDKSPHDVVKET